MELNKIARDGVKRPLETCKLAAQYLKCVAHPHRLRMIELLLVGRYTVGELALACGIPSHVTSEHLRRMQRCKLLTAERDGRKIFYRIVDPGLEPILTALRKWFAPTLTVEER